MDYKILLMFSDECTDEPDQEECKHNIVINKEGFDVCNLCGVTDFNENYKVAWDEQYKVDNPILYKRYNYLIKKIKIFSCDIYPNDNKFSPLFNYIRRHEFKTIDELNLLVKKSKYGFNNYIFLLYYLFKQTKLIKVTDYELNKLVLDFHELMRNNKHFNKKRKHLISYNVIIYLLMKQNNIKNHELLLLLFPNNWNAQLSKLNY